MAGIAVSAILLGTVLGTSMRMMGSVPATIAASTMHGLYAMIATITGITVAAASCYTYYLVRGPEPDNFEAAIKPDNKITRHNVHSIAPGDIIIGRLEDRPQHVLGVAPLGAAAVGGFGGSAGGVHPAAPVADDRIGQILTKLDAQGAKLDAQGAKLDAQGAKLDAQGAKLDAQDTKLNELQMSINYVVPPDITARAGSVVCYLLSAVPPAPAAGAASSAGAGAASAAAGGAAAPADQAASPSPVCCAFFVSPTVALTVSHNVRHRCVSAGIIAARTLSGVDLSFAIITEDPELDFMVLRVLAREETSYFPITARTSCEALLGAQRIALLGCGIAMADETREGTSAQLPLSLTTLPASIIHVGSRHFAYDASTYDGDSGACLFFAQDKTVIGLHLEGINRAKELQEQKDSLRGLASPSSGSEAAAKSAAGGAGGSERPAKIQRTSAVHAELASVKGSIRDIIDSVKTGGLALFLGTPEVRHALHMAGVPHMAAAVQAAV